MRKPLKLWCVKTPMSCDGEIYVEGAAARVLPNGALMIVGGDGDEETICLAFGRDRWHTIHAMDSERDKPAGIKIWQGEV